MDQKTRRTWISIVIAGVIIIGVLAIAIVGGTAYFFFHHINTEYTPKENAEQKFAEARARFAGKQPLIEMRKGDQPTVHRELVDAAHSDAALESLRILAYDPGERKLVRVSIPFWLIRLAPGKNFSFLNDHNIDLDAERVRLNAADLERLGPSLILDQQDRRGAYVLVWTE